MIDRIKYIYNEFDLKKLIKNKKIILMCLSLIVVASFITIKTIVDKPKADTSELPTVLTLGRNTLKDGTIITIWPDSYDSSKNIVSYTIGPQENYIDKFKTITYGTVRFENCNVGQYCFKSSASEERKIKEYQRDVSDLSSKTSNKVILEQAEKVKANSYDTKYMESWVNLSATAKNYLLTKATSTSASQLANNSRLLVYINNNDMFTFIYGGNLYVFPFSKNEGSGSTTENVSSDRLYGKINLNESIPNFAINGTKYLYYTFDTFTRTSSFFYDPNMTIPYNGGKILVPFVDGYIKKFNGANIKFGDDHGIIQFNELGKTTQYNSVEASDLTHISSFNADYVNVPYNVNITFNGVGVQTLTPGSTFTTLPEVPAKTGYKGTGWQMNGVGDIQVGTSKVPYVDSIATPVYKKQTAVTLDAVSSMGKVVAVISSGQIVAQTFDSPHTIYLDANSTLPTAWRAKKDDTDSNKYTFEGWYTAISGGEKVTSETLIPSSDVTYYAHYKYNGSEDENVSITFNGNGGKITYNGMTKDVISTGLTPGSSIGSLPTGTRTGYTFEGIYPTSHGGNRITSSTKVPSTDTTYYALWFPIQYGIEFNSNTGQGKMDNKYIDYDTNYDLPKCSYTKPGYTFDGWATSKDGKVVYKDQAAIKNLSSQADDIVTLWAHWVPNTCTISYDANEGTGTMASGSYTYNVPKKLTKNGFTRKGYTFKQWVNYGIPVELADEASVSNLCDENGKKIVLYAQWTANTYTVKYDGNGATSGSTASSSHTYDVSKALTNNGFSRTGYKFDGWATGASGSVVYSNGQSVKNLTDKDGGIITLYAHWTKDSSSSGGTSSGGSSGSGGTSSGGSSGSGGTSSGGSTTPSTAPTITIDLGGNGNNTTIKANSDGTIPKPADPKKDGYKFEGWYKDKDYTEKWDFSKDKVTKDSTIYAKWTKDTVDEKDEYFVTFNSNGGSKVNSQKVLLGNKVTKPTDPSKANDKFEGWYKDSKFTEKWDFDKDTVTKDTTLYAKWSTTVVDPNKNESSITFETDDGSDISGTTVKNDNKITKPADPEKDGYKFEGWYKDSKFTEKWDFDKDTVTKDTTLYAKWSKIGSSESGKDIAEGNPGSSDSVVNNPKTGDLNMSLILGIMGIATVLMIGSATYIIVSKKNEK